MKIVRLLSLLLFLWYASGGIFTERSEAQEANGTDSASPGASSERADAEALLRAELEMKIRERAQALERVNQELAEARRNLDETSAERVSLQQELKTIEQNISQLNLRIRSDTLTVEKLAYELQTIDFDIRDIREAVGDKRLAIAQVIRKLQENEHESILSILLKNESLADGVLAIQNLRDLNFQLTVDISRLEELDARLTEKIDTLSAKKADIVNHTRNAVYRKAIIEEQQQDRARLVAETKNREVVYREQVTDLRRRQQEVAEEIEAIQSELRAKIDPTLLPLAQSGVLGLPVGGIEVRDLTQGYGATRFARRGGYQGNWHNGIDIGAPLGTPVFAAEDGEVAAMGNQDRYCPGGAYGRFVVVNHDNNLTTLYAHLSKIAVDEGTRVKRGDLVGYIGRTGYATGAHLHFTVFARPTFYMGQSRSCGPMPFGGDLNPINYL